MARWLEVLGTYDFKLQHRPGKYHGNADGLSRRPCSGCSYCEKREGLYSGEEDPSNTLRGHRKFAMRGYKVDPERWGPKGPAASKEDQVNSGSDAEQSSKADSAGYSWITGKSSAELRQAQRDDPQLAEVIRWKEAGERPEWKDVAHQDREVKSYWSQWDRLDLVDGVLRRLWIVEMTGEEVWQLVVPSTLRHEALESLHDGQCAGHMGITRTVGRVQLRFYWYNYHHDTQRWCQRCQTCQKRRNPPRRAKAKLGQYRVGLPKEAYSAGHSRSPPRIHSRQQVHLGDRVLLHQVEGKLRYVQHGGGNCGRHSG